MKFGCSNFLWGNFNKINKGERELNSNGGAGEYKAVSRQWDGSSVSKDTRQTNRPIVLLPKAIFVPREVGEKNKILLFLQMTHGFW